MLGHAIKDIHHDINHFRTSRIAFGSGLGHGARKLGTDTTSPRPHPTWVRPRPGLYSPIQFRAFTPSLPPSPAAKSGFKRPLPAILSRSNRAYAWRRTSHIRDLSAEQLYQMQIKCNPNQSAIKLKSNAIGIIKYKSNVPCLSNTNQMPASSNTHQMYSKSNTIQINIKCEWDYQIQIKCALVIKYKSNAHNIKCTSNILQIKWQSNTTSTIKCNSNTDQILIKWG